MATTNLVPIDTDLEGIGHVLRDRRLSVPRYQRVYSWEYDEVIDYWQDLRAAFVSSAGQYFLGTVVLSTNRSTGDTTIIDGQQRLATTTLLFTAIRNEFLRRGDIHRAEVIERDYILTTDLRTGRLRPRLILNPDDEDQFGAALFFRPEEETPDGQSPPDSGSRLGAALQLLESEVISEARQAGTHWADVLFRWVEFLEDRARVITVDVSDEADAFLIFETMNDRGRELSVADLLKNYLFGVARDHLDEIQTCWLGSLTALEASADEEIFTTFVRHFWSSREGATRERDLYSRIRAAISTARRALSFARQFEEAAPAYAALLSTDNPYWTEHAALAPAAQTLLRLGLEQNRPLLLAAMLRFTEAEFGALLKAVIAWSIRGLIVGGIGGGTTERAYAEAAVAVTEGSAKTAEDVFELLVGIIPTDEIFSGVFATRRINRTRQTKYLLIALTNYENGLDEPMIVDDARESAYTLFSVLPRNADPNLWPHFLPDELGQQALRLGNQFVADKDDTVSPVADLFVSLQHDADWSPAQIDTRQQALARQAVAVWPRRP